MRGKFHQQLYDQCYKLPDGTPDTTREIEFSKDGWLPRRCCETHSKMDKYANILIDVFKYANHFNEGSNVFR